MAAPHVPHPTAVPAARTTVVEGDRGPYRLLRPLGRGGMGVVHLALDNRGGHIAIKRPHPGNPYARRCLRNEAVALAEVPSRRIVELIDVHTTGPHPFLATRYLPGRTLAEHVREDGPLTDGRLHELARGLAEALTMIHAAGLVHRDINPANIICTDTDFVVIDFGLARRSNIPIDNADDITGTAGFLAPEILTGAPATPAADVFAWAATIAYAATGRSPHGTGPTDVIFYRTAGGQADLYGVPDHLHPRLRTALAIRPERRPSAAATMGQWSRSA